MNEQGRLGFHADLVWKEGNDVVALMSRALDRPGSTVAFLVNATDLSKIHFMSGLYLADVPYLGSGIGCSSATSRCQRRTTSWRIRCARLGGLGYADLGAMQILGDHISRNRGYAPVSATIRADEKGRLVLTTVITRR